MLASVAYGMDPALCRNGPLGLFCICAEGEFIGSFQIRKGLPDRSTPARNLCFIGSKKAILIVVRVCETLTWKTTSHICNQQKYLIKRWCEYRCLQLWGSCIWPLHWCLEHLESPRRCENVEPLNVSFQARIYYCKLRRLHGVSGQAERLLSSCLRARYQEPWSYLCRDPQDLSRCDDKTDQEHGGEEASGFSVGTPPTHTHTSIAKVLI